ncbi:MAG: pilus assembly protein PilP [Nitrospiraceae bacterium]|nr:MAG: pilus assembly protein PilP [Nitrospiraceae bacterium]
MIKKFVFLIATMLVFPFSVHAEETKAVTGEESQVATEIPKGGYVYEPGGRRDPFIPLVDVSRQKEVTKSPRVLGTLESYDLPDFKVIAIVDKGQGRYSGLLLAPDNKSFVVRVGTVIGLKKGKIVNISRDRIIVTENIKDYKGELIPREVVLELYEGGAK